MATNGTITTASKQRARCGQEETLPPHKYYENRSILVQNLRRAAHKNGLYSSFIPNLTDLRAFRERHRSIATGEQLRDVEYTMRGRIVTIRSAGERLRFYEVQVGEEEIQVVCQVTSSEDLEAYKQQHEHLARGDQIGITGHPCRSFRSRSPRGRHTAFET